MPPDASAAARWLRRVGVRILRVAARGHCRDARGDEAVAVFLDENVELLDFAGPAEVFAIVGYRVITVARSHEPLRSQGFLTITPEFSFADCPAAEIIVIPGAGTR